MPRYSYLCEFCEQPSDIFHLIDDPPRECPLCLRKDTLVKLVSRPRIDSGKERPSESLRQRVEGHIEEARQELADQRADLVKEDMLNDN